jgi:hypothetical protein
VADDYYRPDAFIFVFGGEVVKRELPQQSQGFGVDTLSGGP